jgi:hypothetical protein
MLYRIHPDPGLDEMLNKSVASFQMHFLKKYPLKWQYVFSRIKDHNPDYFHLNTQIKKQISENINLYFNRHTNNLIDGSNACLMWTILTDVYITGISGEYLESVISSEGKLFNRDSFYSTRTSLLDGYAGTGLTLLSCLERAFTDWLILV